MCVCMCVCVCCLILSVTLIYDYIFSGEWLYTVQCSCTLYSVQRTVYTVHCTLSNGQCVCVYGYGFVRAYTKRDLYDI